MSCPRIYTTQVCLLAPSHVVVDTHQTQSRRHHDVHGLATKMNMSNALGIMATTEKDTAHGVASETAHEREGQ